MWWNDDWIQTTAINCIIEIVTSRYLFESWEIFCNTFLYIDWIIKSGLYLINVIHIFSCSWQWRNYRSCIHICNAERSIDGDAHFCVRRWSLYLYAFIFIRSYEWCDGTFPSNFSCKWVWPLKRKRRAFDMNKTVPTHVVHLATVEWLMPSAHVCWSF